MGPPWMLPVPRWFNEQRLLGGVRDMDGGWGWVVRGQQCVRLGLPLKCGNSRLAAQERPYLLNRRVVDCDVVARTVCKSLDDITAVLQRHGVEADAHLIAFQEGGSFATCHPPAWLNALATAFCVRAPRVMARRFVGRRRLVTAGLTGLLFPTQARQ